MKKYIKLSALSLVASAILIGCGSNSNTSITTDTETGYFIDAPVEGLTYKTTSGLTGTTDAQGRFQYKKGEKVHFSLGKLNFGEAEPTTGGLVSPRELTQNQELVTLMLRTLQALDIDNDPSNGITIPGSVITALQNMGTDMEMSNFSQDSELLDIDTDLSELLDEDYDGEIDVSDTDAKAHFEQSMNSWNGGIRPDNGQNQGDHGDGTGFDLSAYPKSVLTQEIIDSLTYMVNEEKLAYDIYTVLYNYHMAAGIEIKQLANVPKSEQKHVEIMQEVTQRYYINSDTLTDVELEDMTMGQYELQEIQDLYNTLYDKGVASKQAALEVGCMVEVIDINDLDESILQAEAANAQDVAAAFNVLRDGSYNHYWAFDKGLKKMGVSEGCGVLGAEYTKTEEEYPVNNNGH